MSLSLGLRHIKTAPGVDVLSHAVEGRRCCELICLPTYNLDPPADGAGPCLPQILIRGNWTSKTPRRWGRNGPRGASIRVRAQTPSPVPAHHTAHRRPWCPDE